jgi:hypothetical protein
MILKWWYSTNNVLLFLNLLNFLLRSLYLNYMQYLSENIDLYNHIIDVDFATGVFFFWNFRNWSLMRVECETTVHHPWIIIPMTKCAILVLRDRMGPSIWRCFMSHKFSKLFKPVRLDIVINDGISYNCLKFYFLDKRNNKIIINSNAHIKIVGIQIPSLAFKLIMLAFFLPIELKLAN